MLPAAIDRCRVLELGCGNGGNIIPMAEALPGSSFVGIDLSQRQIEFAHSAARTLELRNVQLRQMNVMDVTDDFGQFDYIIAHGIYSWVPPEVKEKLLSVCARNLAPHGVAYVSYNTYPGWHMREMVRDMMLYHSRKWSDPTEKVKQARGVVNFLAQAIPADKTPYGMLLRRELEFFKDRDDNYIMHDHLSEHNDPVYFFQFMERAEAHGLQYLSESDVASATMDIDQSPTVQTLRGVAGSLVEMEQYMDFWRERSFRQTLICHSDVQVQRNIDPSRLSTLHISASTKALGQTSELPPGVQQRFQNRAGVAVGVADPFIRAALTQLGEVWPSRIAFPRLASEARARAGGEASLEADVNTLGGFITRAFFNRFLDIHAGPAPFVSTVSERPVASPLSRLHAATQQYMTSRRHELVDLKPFPRQLLLLLDGTRDHRDLARSLETIIVRGQRERGESLALDDAQRAALASDIESVLQTLAADSLLIA
jgi:SAM-dependent methyltransferase/methyltransferase-like protein